MYVCVYVSIYVRMTVWKYVFINSTINAFTYVGMFNFIFVYMYEHLRKYI